MAWNLGFISLLQQQNCNLIFGRAIINYKDKYLITGTFRADGSTRFGENNKYGYFPSVGCSMEYYQGGFFREQVY